MNVFDEDATLMENAEWLNCLNNDDVDRHAFNDILGKDDFLNLSSDLCTLDELDPVVHFPPGGSDNNSESNSSDSGNYSPKSLSGEQQQVIWPNQEQIKTLYQGDDVYSINYVDAPALHTITQTLEDSYVDCKQPIFYSSPTSQQLHSDAIYADDMPYYSHYSNEPSLYPSKESFHRAGSEKMENYSVKEEPQQIVYVMQKSSSNGIAGQYALPQQKVVLVPTSINMSQPVSLKTTNLDVSQRYPSKRLLPPKTNTLMQRCTPPNVSFQEEEFLRRKEDRKLRNRAAAQLSRLRKRNEFEHLKTQLTKKEKECCVLKNELVDLRKKVARLEIENKHLRDAARGRNVEEISGLLQKRRSVAKKAGGVCALVFMAFMVFPSVDYTPPSFTSISLSPNKSIAHHVESYEPKLPVVGHVLIALKNEEFPNATTSRGLQIFRNVSSLADCPDGNTLYNSSQNHKRVNAELLHWIERHDQMNFVQLRRGNSPSVIFNSRLTTDAVLKTHIKFIKYFSEAQKLAMNETVSMTGLQKASEKSRKFSTGKAKKNDSKGLLSDANRKERTQQKIHREMTFRHLDMITRSNEVQRQQRNNTVADRDDSVRLDEQKMLDFTSKIQQKGDTLYVVALKDYFLLPALNNSKSAPKVSLILPALAANASAPSQLTMMRIECTVVATSVFYLPDSVISLFNMSSSF